VDFIAGYTTGAAAAAAAVAVFVQRFNQQLACIFPSSAAHPRIELTSMDLAAATDCMAQRTLGMYC